MAVARPKPMNTAPQRYKAPIITRLRPKASDKAPPKKPPTIPARAPAPLTKPIIMGFISVFLARYRARKGKLMEEPALARMVPSNMECTIG